MTTYTVSARKYRPDTFKTVVGQQHITQTLRHAIVQAHIPHALLFCGPRGIGKTTCARIMAKAINCEQLTAEGEPCNVCHSCKMFNSGQSYNFYELDAASHNSVDDIRHLIEQVRIPPQNGRYKTYIIDEVHMLSASAFNAFLKTLEEPPSYAIFILATTEKHKILPTILSRCQIFDFNRITVSDMVAHLEQISEQEGIKAHPDALHVVAEKADGALRDALSMYDRITAYAGTTDIGYKDAVDTLNILDYAYYFRVADAIADGDSGTVLLIFDEILHAGFDGHVFINGLAQHFRQLFVCFEHKTLPLLEMPDNRKSRYQQQVARFDRSLVLSALSILNQCDVHYKEAKDQRLHVEMGLLKLAYLKSAFQVEEGQSASLPDSQNGSAHTGHTSSAPHNNGASPSQSWTQSPSYAKKKGDDPGAEAADSEPVSAAPQKADGSGDTWKKPASEDPLPPPESPELPDGLPVIEVGYQQENGGQDEVKAGRGSVKQVYAQLKKKQKAEEGASNPHEETPTTNAAAPPLEEVKEAVVSIATVLRDQHQRALAEALQAYAPESEEGPLVRLHFDSKPMVHKFEEQRGNISQMLCEALSLTTLKLEVNFVQPDEQVKKPMLFTDKEKYEHMVGKNPEIDNLRQRLQLIFR